MPGAYAHFVLVKQSGEAKKINQLPDFPRSAQRSLNAYSKYATLGSVSPDLPYLGFDTVWANRLHLEKTGQVIKRAAHLIREMENKEVQSKCFAWLLGYASHVGGDITVHP